MRILSLSLVLAVAGTVALGAGEKPAKEKPSKENPKKAQQGLGALLQGGADGFIKRFDKNGDGVLTKDELPERLAERFSRIDANGDGKLDKAEVERMLEVL